MDMEFYNVSGGGVLSRIDKKSALSSA